MSGITFAFTPDCSSLNGEPKIYSFHKWRCPLIGSSRFSWAEAVWVVLKFRIPFRETTTCIDFFSSGTELWTSYLFLETDSGSCRSWHGQSFFALPCLVSFTAPANTALCRPLQPQFTFSASSCRPLWAPPKLIWQRRQGKEKSRSMLSALAHHPELCVTVTFADTSLTFTPSPGRNRSLIKIWRSCCHGSGTDRCRGNKCHSGRFKMDKLFPLGKFYCFLTVAEKVAFCTSK